MFDVFHVEVIVEVDSQEYRQTIPARILNPATVRVFWIEPSEGYRKARLNEMDLMNPLIQDTLKGMGETIFLKAEWRTTLGQGDGYVRMIFDESCVIGVCPVTTKEKGGSRKPVIELPIPQLVDLETGQIYFQQEMQPLEAYLLAA